MIPALQEITAFSRLDLSHQTFNLLQKNVVTYSVHTGTRSLGGVLQRLSRVSNSAQLRLCPMFESHYSIKHLVFLLKGENEPALCPSRVQCHIM